MLRTVFFGTRWSFGELLVDWLARHSDLAGVIWINSLAWQDTWPGRLRFARRRLERRGLIKTVDEALFYLYYHAAEGRRESRRIDEDLVPGVRRRLGLGAWSGDTHVAEDVNSPRCLDFLRRCAPDAVFAACMHQYVRRPFRRIPRLGVFLWHEGITPEYRGLYSPFWAVHNLDFDRIGYTLLRLSDAYDAGDVFAQGPAEAIDPFRDGHGYLGHKAILDGLPAVAALLDRLEAGTATPLHRPAAVDRYYTYPGISDAVRRWLRLRRKPSGR